MTDGSDTAASERRVGGRVYVQPDTIHRMAVVVRFEDWHDAVHIINCLLAVADTRGPDGVILARRLTRIAYDLGDAIDACPVRDFPNRESPRPSRPARQYEASKKAVDEAGYDLVVS